MHRNEYPRPDFVRDKWLCLNGEWDFRFESEAWRKINVPFAFQSKLSGINENRLCSTVWYRKKFKAPEEWKGSQVALNFGAVDYKCRVFINGHLAGEHIGGNSSFSFDITDFLNWSEEEILVHVEDPWNDETIPRGKQSWLENSKSIWYSRTTGIWQSVWIEPLNIVNLEYMKFTPDIDDGNIDVEFEISRLEAGLRAELQISFQGRFIINDTISLQHRYNKRSINLFNKHIFRTATHHSGWCWTPETPNIFEIKVKLVTDNTCLDEVDSYFSMRKIHTDNGIIYLNNRPYYQKLVLDQGYWPEGLLTAPSDESFKLDIDMAKKMGFNGCRKHQKVEDPRFAYWADKLGFLIWCEMPSCAAFSHESVERTIKEWMETIKRDYNHPSIVAWVPLNESWGIPSIDTNKMEQHHSLTMYHLTHSLDNTRLVISNDGWELTKTDICAVHNYNHGSKGEEAKFNYYKESLAEKENILVSQPAGRKIYAKGFEHRGEPFMLTEFGGIAFNIPDSLGWGYTVVSTEKEFLEVYERIIEAVYNSKAIYGFCYTQLTDVEQEINGLLTYDRKPKCQLESIKEINGKYRNNIVL
jgi:beta-galactosidase/beta-glucuronidase